LASAAGTGTVAVADLRPVREPRRYDVLALLLALLGVLVVLCAAVPVRA
jgi:hypothetical protein